MASLLTVTRDDVVHIEHDLTQENAEKAVRIISNTDAIESWDGECKRAIERAWPLVRAGDELDEIRDACLGTRRRQLTDNFVLLFVPRDPGGSITAGAVHNFADRRYCIHAEHERPYCAFRIVEVLDDSGVRFVPNAPLHVREGYYESWTSWFAWRPVRTEQDRVRWLGWTHRRFWRPAAWFCVQGRFAQYSDEPRGRWEEPST